MKKRIAVVTEFYSPHIGGQEIRLAELAQCFIKEGHAVDILTIRYDDKLARNEEKGNLKIQRIVDDFGYKGGNGLKDRSWKTILFFSFQSCKLLKANRYDFVVFSQFPLLPIVNSRFVGITTKRVLDFVEYRKGLFWYFIQKMILLSSDRVVCISDSVAEQVRKIGRRNSVSVIPSLVDIETFQEAVNPQHFAFIGRLEAHKHPEDAIEAVIQYNKKYQTTNLIHVVGGGALLEKLRENYSSCDNVIIHGYTSNEVKKKILAESIALILPSEREGLPMSVIEAVASCVPIITTDYPNNGTKDFVRQEMVGLVTIPQLELMVETIHELITQRDQYVEICKKIKQRFSLKNGAQSYIKIGLGDKKREL
ncbi:MAG: glycosyltransferase family 4 protein [Desulfosporosinus sp.]|nr:glycosyltransferase family 4 protein [Desulfosporosinus sp.]